MSGTDNGSFVKLTSSMNVSIYATFAYFSYCRFIVVDQEILGKMSLGHLALGEETNPTRNKVERSQGVVFYLNEVSKMMEQFSLSRSSSIR